MAAAVAAVAGTLAVGDALNVIDVPAYQLGLPDAARSDFIVLVFGVGLMVPTDRLVLPSVGEVLSGVAATPPAVGSPTGRVPPYGQVPGVSSINAP